MIKKKTMKIDFAKKKIAILGFGQENQTLFAWLVEHGAKDITICDHNPKLKIKNQKLKTQIENAKIEYRLGKNYLKNLADFDLVFRTPGIPYLLPDIQKAKRAGVEISSQMKLFFDLCPARIIGVTGTKGKGTTVSLITAILKSKTKNQKPKIWSGGNIGNPPIEFLDRLKKDDIVVLELSSFQLQDMTKSPHIAVVLDITCDHLDKHLCHEEYVGAKENIVRWQTKDDFTIINADYLTSFRFASLSPSDGDYYFSRRKSVDLGAYVQWLPKGRGGHLGKIILRTDKGDQEICRTYDIQLKGLHNLENILAAVTVSYLAGSDIGSSRKVVTSFPGLPHRLELVAEIRGVKYHNDSASTNPDTAIAAIRAFAEPVILIVGGSDKGLDYTGLGQEIARSTVKTVILIGETALRIKKSLHQCNSVTMKPLRLIEGCRNIQEVVAAAAKEAKQGDIVLLSPGAASFDWFKNYPDRGNQFKKALKNLE